MSKERCGRPSLANLFSKYRVDHEHRGHPNVVISKLSGRDGCSLHLPRPLTSIVGRKPNGNPIANTLPYRLNPGRPCGRIHTLEPKRSRRIMEGRLRP